MPDPVEITHLIFACDESAAKGGGDQDEHFPGEVGVFAGLLVPAEVSGVLSDFDAVAEKYAPAEGKLHIADLPAPQQQALRAELFDLVHKHRIPCFYEAIHVAGFHRAHNEVQALYDAAKAASKIRPSRNRARPDVLHVALFQGLYAQIIAFCLERQRTTLRLDIITDRVDTPIVNAFRTVVEEFLNFDAVVGAVSAYSQKLKKRVPVAEFRIEGKKEDDIPVLVKELELTIVDDTDGLVLAADVLANSLTYLFHSRLAGEQFRALNSWKQ